MKYMHVMQRIKNKKAYFDYEVLETYEAGLKLTGSEVKSLRQGHANLKGNFVHEWHGELWVEGIHISKYKYSAHLDINPWRKRKLLLNRKEIIKIVTSLQQKGVSVTVLELYDKHNLIKCTLGLVRGKKLHDKREVMKRRDSERRLQRIIKQHV